MNICEDCICRKYCGDDDIKRCDRYFRDSRIKKEQTNEEWFVNLPTKEKARFFSHEMRCEFCPNQEQCDSLGANCKVLWELWLKQPHTDKE